MTFRPLCILLATVSAFGFSGCGDDDLPPGIRANYFVACGNDVPGCLGEIGMRFAGYTGDDGMNISCSFRESGEFNINVRNSEGDGFELRNVFINEAGALVSESGEASFLNGANRREGRIRTSLEPGGCRMGQVIFDDDQDGRFAQFSIECDRITNPAAPIGSGAERDIVGDRVSGGPATFQIYNCDGF